MRQNRVLFPISTLVYDTYTGHAQEGIFEDFDGGKNLAITPRPEDLTIEQADNRIGNRIKSGYSDRQQFSTYSFDLNFAEYFFYKILQRIQVDADAVPTQVEMLDFINPDIDDIKGDGYTRRYGVISELELIGSTNNRQGEFDSGSGAFLRGYRCQGVRFRFEERGIPIPLTLTTTAGSLTVYPLRGELDPVILGEDLLTDGYSQSFVEVERKRREFTVNIRTSNQDEFNTLLALQDSQVNVTTGIFTRATLEYDGGSYQGTISNVSSQDATYTRYNKVTTLQEKVIGGFTFKFTEV